MSRTNVFKITAILVILASALWVQVCTVGGVSAPRDDVRVVVERSSYMNRRVAGLEDAPTLGQRAGLLPAGRYRYYWPLEREDFPEGRVGVFIGDSGGMTFTLVNGALMSRSVPQGLNVPGLGAQWRLTEAPSSVLVPGANRIELVTDHEPLRTGLRVWRIGAYEQMSQRLQRWVSWLYWMPRLALVLAGLGVGLSLSVILAYGGKKPSHVIWGGVAIVYLVQVFTALVGGLVFSPGWVAMIGYVTPVLIALGLMAQANRTRAFAGDWRAFNPDRVLFTLAIGANVLLVVGGFVPLGVLSPTLMLTLGLLSVGSLVVIEPAADLFRLIAKRSSRMQALTRKVHEQALELDEKSRQVAYEMRNRAILEERQRFTRDIHDGIGGQLLSLLLRIRSGVMDNRNISEEIQASLNDLRLVVDSIDHVGDDLGAALTTFRVRAEPQMKAAGIGFDWRQPDELRGHLRGTGATLHLYRMIQECLANAIRHARASHLMVRIEQPAPDQLVLSIRDDGVGISRDQAGAPRGKGIRNMYRRAELLGAELAIEPCSEEGGTCVTITAPLMRSQDQILIQPM
ncbi:sensor histidine kinase [Oceanicaulis sp. LC35]|uniref:sensor histidine kinase n=1 Tax=Oceanicaulis sp. LC35 TaxID=3349635 RepID=UPI003F82BA5E